LFLKNRLWELVIFKDWHRELVDFIRTGTGNWLCLKDRHKELFAFEEQALGTGCF